MADAAASYVGLRLGAREVVLPYLNESPWAVWLVTTAMGIYILARLGVEAVPRINNPLFFRWDRNRSVTDGKMNLFKPPSKAEA